MRPATKLLHMPASMKLEVGQHLRGKAGSYKVLEQLHRDVWTAMYEIPLQYPYTSDK